MTDIEARADRIRAIAECVGGKVLSGNGAVLQIEIPADAASNLAPLWGDGGFVPIFRRQEFRVGAQQTIIRDGIPHTDGSQSRAWFVYDVDIRPTGRSPRAGQGPQ